MDKQIYIIHENDEWVVPLREELKKIKLKFSSIKYNLEEDCWFVLSLPWKNWL